MNIEKIKNNPKMPKHIAFIIDGNGRWAKQRGFDRSVGHKYGFENLKRHVDFVASLGIKNMSVYCFSAENWNRPQPEVDYLMQLFDTMLDELKEKYLDRDFRVIISGDMTDERIPENVRKKAIEVMELTKDKTGFVFNACINYGGRQEILRAVNKLLNKGIKEVDAKTFESQLYTADLLPLDYIIRTSGENRTSNFLPWQATYSELYFPKKHWPGFTQKDIIKALKVYFKRNRRFGAIKG